jgi:hypothetical protein
MIQVKEKSEFGMKRVVMCFVLHAWGAQIVGKNMQVNMSTETEIGERYLDEERNPLLSRDYMESDPDTPLETMPGHHLTLDHGFDRLCMLIQLENHFFRAGLVGFQQCS